MAAELVETNRLWARRVAAIEPAWAERLGEHLVRRSYGEPRWDERRGAAVTSETVTLYGLPIVSGRTVPVRPHRRRRRPLAVHPPRPRARRVVDAPRVRRAQPAVPRSRAGPRGPGAARPPARRRRAAAVLRRAAARRHHVGAPLRPVVPAARSTATCSTSPTTCSPAGAGFRTADYPDTWRQGDLVLPLSYRYDPGGPLDGVTVHVPLTALNRVTDDGLRLADRRATAASSSRRSCGRCPRTSAAS